jgi:hypothetical protein
MATQKRKPTTTRKGTPVKPTRQRTILRVELEKQDFEGELAAFVFDSAGQLLNLSRVTSGKVVLPLDEQTLMRSRLYIAPLTHEDLDEQKPTLKSMSRLGAYQPAMRVSGSLIETIRVPDVVIVDWLLCTCWVRGRVVKADSGLPICGAKVHICEVDKFFRWIIQLPEPDLYRLRDDLLREIEVPELRVPPRPGPDPSPFDLVEPVDFPMNIVAFNPQPEPPGPPESNLTPISLPQQMKTQLLSSSAQIVRDALVANLELLRPYLCLWPYWWRFRCDEITVVESDGFGNFEAAIKYQCLGDKPDLYFWVEYPIGAVLETVYKPPIPCHTYWNYECGTEVTIQVADERVPACDPEPDPVGCKVQIISIGRRVSMSEIHGDGASLTNEGLTTGGAPFGGKLEPRVWFGRSDLLAKGIEYYRWSYRRLSEGDGTSLVTPGSWTQMTRTVVRHYAKEAAGEVTHEPFALGPFSVGTASNLFKIKPAVLPPGGIEWSVMDEREDLASAHFESQKLGTGVNACARALVAAGKYELKLELFRGTGNKVANWEDEGIDLEMTDVPAPFGTNTVTTEDAPNYNRIKSGGKTQAFSMVLRVDNNCCSVGIDDLVGAGPASVCGFYEVNPATNVKLGFSASHPNDFATFQFSVRQGVTTQVRLASASGRVGNSPIPVWEAASMHTYTLSGPGDYSEWFTVAELLGSCTRAAYSEALHVWTMAQNGYGRLHGLDRFTHAGFALVPPEV